MNYLARQVCVLQCQSSRDPQQNLAQLTQLLAQHFAAREQAEQPIPLLVVLPECVLMFGGGRKALQRYVAQGEFDFQGELAKLAQRFQIWLVAGSVPVLSEQRVSGEQELGGSARYLNRSYLFNAQGQTLGYYDKIHLFDVDVADNTAAYRESDVYQAGEQLAIFDTPFGRLGLAICYDLRFPRLFLALREAGAELIAVPAAFTQVTGQAHWQTLIQARALDSQCYLLAAGQWGQDKEHQRATWGHSMIVDPWGQIIAQQADGDGCLLAPLDLQYLTQVRRKMPLMAHQVLF